ncbi:MAG TPA: response regulator transcription factor [Chloroflexota bacterium]|nr:response regulator transcription factor [Chloroflexota bacterium]
MISTPPPATRVVLIDDQPDFLTWARAVLEEDGSFVVAGSYTDAEQALSEIVRLQPDLLLVDFEMPVMTGFEVARRVKELAPDIDVLLMSLHNSTYFEMLARLSGARGFLPKQQFQTAAIRSLLRVGAGQA